MVRCRSVFGLTVLLAALMAARSTAAPPAAIPTPDAPAQPAPRLEGKVELIAPLPPPRDGMLEVYLRNTDDTVPLVIVPVAISGDTATGAYVSFAARDDGEHTYTDRAGTSRTVRRVVALTPPTLLPQRLDDFTIMLGALAFGVVAAIVARSKRQPSIMDGFEDDTGDALAMTGDADLPEDPAAAMAELARRSEDGE